MSHKSICGCMPVGASSGFNLYSPTFVRGLRADELPEMARAYGRSVNLAREAGFDSVEIHAGHGYLISQFLYPVHQPSERRVRRLVAEPYAFYGYGDGRSDEGCRQ